MSRPLIQAMLSVALLVAGAAHAQAVARAPSMARVGAEVAITGAGFSAGTLVSLRITGPNQAVSMAAVVAAADGSVSYALVPTSSGSWRVQLSDGNERNKGAEVKLMVAP